MRHLIAKGHRQIAFITSDDEEFSDARHRLAGYLDGLKEAGIEADTRLIATAYADEVGGHVAAAELMSREQPFTAFVAFNDAMAAGAISYLIEQGISVPEQISAVGFDDIPYIRFIRPKLTTVRYPIEAIGEQAAELAVRLLDEKPLDGLQLKFVPEMVIRDSVRG